MKRIDGQRISTDKFMKLYRDKKPVIIRNMIRDWSAYRTWNKKEFANRYGHLEVDLERQVVDSESSTSRSETQSMTIGEYINSNQQHDIALSFNSYKIHQTVYHDVSPMPPLLRNIIAEPVFSLGREGTGADFHYHEETWLAQIIGRKMWFVAPQETKGLEKLRGREPCSFPRSSKGIHSTCVVAPGEVLYLPTEWHHATCNLDDPTVGVGGRGETTSVHEACGRCSSSSLVDSLKQGDPNSLDSFGRHPLFICTSSGCTEGVRQLLSHSKVDVGINVTYLDGGQALHVAAKDGHTHLVNMLMDHNASVSATDEKGLQPIHLATLRGHVDVVNAIVARRACTAVEASNGNSPIHTAAMSGHAQLVDLLARYRADIGASNKKGSQPMHFAAYKGHTKVLDVLIRRRSSLTAVDEHGGKPIDWATAGRHATVVELLTSLETQAVQPARQDL